MAEAALRQRTIAAEVLILSIRELRKYKETPNRSTRLLKQKFDKVAQAKDEILKKHHMYAEKSGQEPDLNELREWITPQIDEATDLCDEVFVLIEELENRDDLAKSREISDLAKAAIVEKTRNESDVLEMQCNATETIIKDRLRAMLEIIENEEKNSIEDQKLVSAYVGEVESFLEEQTGSWKQLKMINADDNAKLTEIFDKESDLKLFVSQRRLLAVTFVKNLSGTVKKEDNINFVDRDSSIHLQKMKPPSFSGSIRSFARFKADFKMIVEKRYTDKIHQAYILKENCLHGDAKKIVENISDIDKIWRRLHDKYGDNLEIVNAILKEIEQFSYAKGNHDEGLVNLVDALEKGLQDLEIINAKDEITNAYTVKLLETKLSKRVLAKWFEKEVRDDNDDGKARFDKLLAFLLEERRQTERLMQLKPQNEYKENLYRDVKKKNHLTATVQKNLVNSERQKFNNSCLIHPNSNHLTRRCSLFRQKTAQERGEVVKSSGGCKLCLSQSHVGEGCPFESSWGTCKINGCTEYHSHLLHGCGVQGISMHVRNPGGQNDLTLKNSVLLLVEKVKTNKGDILTFWDSGSTIALVAKSYVKQLHLTGIPVSYELITVGGVVSNQDTSLHEIILIDRDGNKHNIKAYEIDDICGEIKAVSIDGIMHLFPYTELQDIRRCSGKVELLIGMEHAKLHPNPICERDGLVLYESFFGTGKILGGSHDAIECRDKISSSVQTAALAQLCHVKVKRKLNPGIDFFTAEEFGVKVPPRCHRCRDCKECKFETHQLSRIEQNELDVIRNNLYLDPIENKWTTTYPYKTDPCVLEDNRSQAMLMLVRTEKRLSRSMSSAEKYCEQFRDFIERGIITEITEEEDQSYSGPRFYISHHEVFKEGSSSTPVRLVINSSLKYHGIGLNDILMKGPNALNDLFGIQLRFRKHYYALVGDVRKMYHSIQTTERERHLRRILWREMKTDENPKVYGPQTVMFGDRPAAAISAVAIRETADIYKHYDEVVSKIIQEDMYVDDLCTGGESKDEIERYKEKVSEILGKGGFSMKGYVTSFDNTSETLALLGTGELGRVLGIHWDPAQDEFAVIARVNLSKKYKGARSEPDYTIEEIPKLMYIELTRRKLLSIVNSCYDPLGLLSPITVQLKIELRSLYNKDLGLGWDDPIPENVKAVWVKLIQLLKGTESVRFPRCIKPKHAIGDPDLILFNDGSNDAMCAVAYLRWELSDDEYVCCMWVAKTRVTPLHKTSIPRIEMQSAVISARLSKAIKEHSRLKFKNIYYILDSKCTMALLRKDTMALKEYMGNRVSEILESTMPEQWFHVKSSDNIADLGTRRSAGIEDVSRESVWQLGPEWLKLSEEKWPTSQSVCATNIPDEEILQNNVIAVTAVSTPSINLDRFKGKGYDFLIMTMAIIGKVFKKKSFKIGKITVEDLERGELLCLKLSMNSTTTELKKGRFRSLLPRANDDGVIVLGGRAVNEFKSHYDRGEFPILTENDTLAHVWMKKIHEENHTGITSTVAKSRRRYWVIRARKLAKRIKNSCYKCRLMDKKLCQQQMAPLPKTRLKLSPTFNTISMDLFGPFEIRGTVKQRTRKKVWGVVFSCTVTRALYVDITEDYSTEAVLQAIRRFVSIRGCPSEIQSDQGSQLIAAAKDIAELSSWNWQPIESWALSNRIKWTLAPAEGQHQNGLSESLIKSVKRTIKHKLGSQILTFSQLQMIFFEIANIVNSRPIGIIAGSDPDHPKTITPNDLILGRSSNEVPQGPFDSNKSITKRFRFLQNLICEWWTEWYKTVLPSLVPCYKWLQRHRSVQVGDVCLIRYGKDKRASYRLGRVKEVKQGVDGLTRKVILNYKLLNEKQFRTVERPIHGIAVIVPIEEQNSDILLNNLNPEANAFHPTRAPVIRK